MPVGAAHARTLGVLVWTGPWLAFTVLVGRVVPQLKHFVSILCCLRKLCDLQLQLHKYFTHAVSSVDVAHIAPRTAHIPLVHAVQDEVHDLTVLSDDPLKSGNGCERETATSSARRPGPSLLRAVRHQRLLSQSGPQVSLRVPQLNAACPMHRHDDPGNECRCAGQLYQPIRQGCSPWFGCDKVVAARGARSEEVGRAEAASVDEAGIGEPAQVGLDRLAPGHSVTPAVAEGAHLTAAPPVVLAVGDRAGPLSGRLGNGHWLSRVAL